MEWPSERVAQGGIFQPPKVKYSPETKKILQELMQESKMSTFQRNKINYSLRNGEPLPSLASTSSLPEANSKKPNIILKTGFSKRKGYNSIVESGVYDRDRYVPPQRGVDRDYAKKHLQDFMAYGKEVKKTEVPVKKLEEKQTPQVNRFDEIKQEIQERMEFLADMEKLGEGHKYKITIQQQIAARMREMARLQLSKTATDTKKNN